MIAILAYLGRPVWPIKTNLSRSSIVVAGLFLLGPIGLRALFLRVTRHELEQISDFRNLTLVVLTSLPSAYPFKCLSIIRRRKAPIVTWALTCLADR